MKKQFRTIFLLLLGTLGALSGRAQDSRRAAGSQAQSFSLKQAIDYALENQERIKIAKNETEISKAKVGEIRAIGLPQISIGSEVGNNFVLQKTVLDPTKLGAPEGTPKQAVALGLPWSGSAAISGSQLLFDGSYLIGLQAASTYTQLAKKQVTQSEIQTIEQVSKAYYSVLVSNARRELLEQNMRRLDTLLRQTSIMNKNGFAEKLDVDRLTVSLNNLKTESQRTDRLIDLSVNLLKFQMGMEQSQPIVLTDKLADVEVDMSKINTTGFNYSNRIEYSILETQRDLAQLDIKNIRAGYYPRLVLTSRYGYVGYSDSMSDLLNIRAAESNGPDRNWFNFGYVGLALQVPVFDGFSKHYRGQQARLRVENANHGLKLTEQGIDLELTQSSTNLTNALQQLESQKQNLLLAQDIARVAKIKYQEGVGSNLEVITAETDLRTAQTNYYAALYDALISKVDLEKANGTLLQK